MTESAQVFKGVHDIPVYTDILFNKPLRLWVAISLYGGSAATIVLTILMLDSGHARAALICGLLATGAAAGVAALMPRGRPTFAVPATQHLARPAPRGWPPAPATPCSHHRTPSSATSVSPRTASTPTTCSAGCPTTCNPPNAASTSLTATRPSPAKSPPAHGPSGSPCPKTNASWCALCCTATATNRAGSTPAARWPPSSPTKTPAPASTGWPCPSTPATPDTARSAKSPNCATG